jgi:hypothetical protein
LNTRARVPLDWAATQMTLGTALAALGERESGTARLEEAVAAYLRILWHQRLTAALDRPARGQRSGTTEGRSRCAQEQASPPDCADRP